MFFYFVVGCCTTYQIPCFMGWCKNVRKWDPDVNLQFVSLIHSLWSISFIPGPHILRPPSCISRPGLFGRVRNYYWLSASGIQYIYINVTYLSAADKTLHWITWEERVKSFRLPWTSQILLPCTLCKTSEMRLHFIFTNNMFYSGRNGLGISFHYNFYNFLLISRVIWWLLH